MSEKILINTGPSERGIHRLASFMRCPQLYAYERLIAPDGDSRREPLVRGSIGHAGLAHHFARALAHQRGEDPDRYYVPETAMELVAKTFGEVGAAMLAPAVRAVRGYIAKTVYEEFEIVAVEHAVRATIRWPEEFVQLRPERADKQYFITQRLDRVFKDKSGRIWLEDHKFVAKIQSKTVSRYTLSNQFHLMFHFGEALYGNAFAGARINLLECASDPNAPPKSLQVPCEPAPHAVRNFVRNICDAEEYIARLDEEKRDPWQYPMAVNEQVCISPYGLCDWFEACRWGKAGL